MSHIPVNGNSFVDEFTVNFCTAPTTFDYVTQIAAFMVKSTTESQSNIYICDVNV